MLNIQQSQEKLDKSEKLWYKAHILDLADEFACLSNSSLNLERWEEVNGKVFMSLAVGTLEN